MSILKNVKIVNLFLTRRCNLKCSYCRISGDIDYEGKPDIYPNMKDYYNKEQEPERWIEFLEKLLEENPDVFLILYGGEPLLYVGLPDIVNFLNRRNSYYTIISNCTPATNSLREKLFSRVGRVRGFTASIDPLLAKDIGNDEYMKSHYGFNILKDLISRNLVDDPVAEITCDYKTIFEVEKTIALLSENDIWSDLTVLCPAKSPWYDFSNITDPNMLVPKSRGVLEIFQILTTSNYKIHMKEILLPKIYEILPADLHCNIGLNNFSTLCIDSDFCLRLCLRIRGKGVPEFNAMDLFNDSKIGHIKHSYHLDYINLCRGCSWTCPLIAQADTEKIIDH